jgi:hypothetical protein
MMGGIYGFEGFVDSYYDTMGKAEELYEYFIEEAVKLYHEINRLDNVIPKPFFAIDTLEGVWESRQEVRDRFDEWVDKVRVRVSEIVKHSGLYMVEFSNEWIVLPFDLSVIPYTYDNDFSTLVDILTEYSHGNMFNNGTNVPHFHDYCEYGNMKHEDMIKVFQQGLGNIGKVRNSKLELVEDLCDELREQFSSSKLLKECENYVFK